MDNSLVVYPISAPPVMLEAWLRESRVRLPALQVVMLETWPRGLTSLPKKEDFLISSANLFFMLNYHTSLSPSDNGSIWDKYILSCLKLDCGRAAFDSPP